MAARQIEDAVARRPDDYDTRMEAARAYMAANFHARAIPHLRAATRLRPRSAFAWVALGDALLFCNQLPEAERAYVEARRLDPSSDVALRGYGQLLVKQGRLKEAMKVLEEGVRQHPESLDLRLALGNLLIGYKHAPQAIEVLKPAVQQAPDNAEAHFLLGQAYEGDFHIRTALAEQQAAVALEPNFTEAWGRIGLYQVTLGDYRAARPALETAIRLDPRESHYYWALGESYLMDLSDPGSTGRAIDLYRKAVSLDPGNQKALYSLGVALTRRGGPGDLQEALAALQKAVRLKPDDLHAYYKLSEASRRLGRSADAARYLARFRELSEQDRTHTVRQYQMVSFRDTAEAHLRLGQRYLKEGKTDLAAAEFGFALEREPKLEAARRGLEEARAPRAGAPAAQLPGGAKP